MAPGRLCLQLLTIALVLAQFTQAIVVTGEIYSLDNFLNGSVLSLEAWHDVEVATFSRQSIGVPGQRFIARTNNDNTFHLFLEQQPWNWVNDIVESSKTVHIKETPRVLEARIVNGVKEVVQTVYKGTSSSSQKWYIVPLDNDPGAGVITNLLHRECINNNGIGTAATLIACSRSDPRQVFRFVNRSQGRCY